MKIGKTEVDNNLIIGFAAVIIAYLLLSKLFSGIKSGYGTLIGENPKDKETRIEEEQKGEVKNYSVLTPQYSGYVLRSKKWSKDQILAYLKKVPYTNLRNRAKAIDEILHTLWVSDEDANKIINIIDQIPTRFQISYMANIYPTVAGGSNLESDIQKYLDEDEKAELFKRINKKPIL
jgi:hypothetical protein